MLYERITIPSNLRVLTYCLTSGFPAFVTEAFLLLATGRYDYDHGSTLEHAHDEWEQWGEQDDVDFIDAVNTAIGDEVTNCDECATLVWVDESTEIEGVGWVCDASCLDNYTRCDDCHAYVDSDTTTEVARGNDVCESCIDSYYRCEACDYYVSDATYVSGSYYCDSDCLYEHNTYCEECEEWYPNDDNHGSEHDCECEAPRKRFTFPANGHGFIAQDERLLVELPKGTIDDEGMQNITRMLDRLVNSPTYRVDVSALVAEVGPLWQARRGNFTRRLSAMFYKAGIKLEPDTLTAVGNLARQHSGQANAWHIEVTRDLNQPAEAFYHEGSCWWQSYSYSRCALKNWGGIGLRSYESEGAAQHYPSGRAWIQPLNEELRATHDAADAHAYVVYNGYGEMAGYVPVRIVAYLTGKTYKRIEFSAGDQYVNGNVGYLIADDATCDRTNSVRISGGNHETLDAHTFDQKAEVA